MKVVLSIAGSDPSGGAGIQADIKTIAAHKLYAETAITALTAQNTTGVFGVEDVSPGFVAQQIDAVFDDIRPDAVKVGMVSSAGIIEVVADRLRSWEAENIVVDPVMVATTGARLIGDDAVGALCELLIPLADIITPNLPEAEALCGRTLATEEDLVQAACELAALCKGSVLIKGGHREDVADDLLVSAGEEYWLCQARIDTKDTHGTGCTLSSAIACNLAIGMPMEAAVERAKKYVTGALLSGLQLGHGNGPLDHMWEY